MLRRQKGLKENPVATVQGAPYCPHLVVYELAGCYRCALCDRWALQRLLMMAKSEQENRFNRRNVSARKSLRQWRKYTKATLMSNRMQHRLAALGASIAVGRPQPVDFFIIMRCCSYCALCRRLPDDAGAPESGSVTQALHRPSLEQGRVTKACGADRSDEQ
jgi:hypothetical protein